MKLFVLSSSFSSFNNSSTERWPGTLRSSFQTLWPTIGWRCISKYDLTCAFFLPTEVQDLSRAPTHFLSFPPISLAVGCDPGNVIQMSCVTGLTALVSEASIWPASIVAERALCRRKETPGKMHNGVLRTRSGRKNHQDSWAMFSARILKVLLRSVL